MQLMCDAISVLGSRHGLVMDPIHKECSIIRFDKWDTHFGKDHGMARFGLRAGVRIEGREYLFPLCKDGGTFSFFDQRLSPCSTSFTGVHDKSAIKVKLEFVTPFKPRDATFSTTPVIGVRLSAVRLPGQFRYVQKEIDVKTVEVFLEWEGECLTLTDDTASSINMGFDSTSLSTVKANWGESETPKIIPQKDRLLVTSGVLNGRVFSQTVELDSDKPQTLDVSWVTFSEPALWIKKEYCPFKYTESFSSLDDVTNWAKQHSDELWDNAEKVKKITGSNNISKSVNNLMAYTLHSWLINTWWALRGDKDWFSVWEGVCYMHSTVDVEFTQSPFYLSVWPELLAILLDNWPEFSKSGEALLGDGAKDTLFLSHDMGSFNTVHKQVYPHEMEVEETSNYVLLAYAYWKRTGDADRVKKQSSLIIKYLDFLMLCDTTGNGVPDMGVSNTIDDASPAIQFGKEQIYLAVKTCAAFKTGVDLLTMAGVNLTSKSYIAQADKILKVIEEKGWADDHFVTLLEKKGMDLIDPWTGERRDFEEVPGWDSPHIYTANALGVLDMVGYKSGIDESRLVTDLKVATEKCLREYGCVHSDYANSLAEASEGVAGLFGSSSSPGWVSMNMLRDMAAFYRGVDLRHLAERYWDWQVVTNTQEPKIFFETFKGNNLSFYPRGVAIWGYFEALAGAVINKADNIDTESSKFPQLKVPRLFDADWGAGNCRLVET